MLELVEITVAVLCALITSTNAAGCCTGYTRIVYGVPNKGLPSILDPGSQGGCTNPDFKSYNTCPVEEHCYAVSGEFVASGLFAGYTVSCGKSPDSLASDLIQHALSTEQPSFYIRWSGIADPPFCCVGVSNGPFVASSYTLTTVCPTAHALRQCDLSTSCYTIYGASGYHITDCYASASGLIEYNNVNSAPYKPWSSVAPVQTSSCTRVPSGLTATVVTTILFSLIQ
jgi:hypothetical protein